MTKEIYIGYRSSSTKDTMEVIHFYATLKGVDLPLESFRYCLTQWIILLSPIPLFDVQNLIKINNFVFARLDKHFEL